MTIDEVFSHPVTRQLLDEVPRMSVGYVARDGSPRVIPVSYLWDGTSLVFWTIPTSSKVRALRADPRVAITIDVGGPPPRLLLVRGRARLTDVEGVPDGYLEGSHRTMPQEKWADFDAQVRSLYVDGMTEVAVTPDWAKIIDFESNAPSEVERLMAAKG